MSVPIASILQRKGGQVYTVAPQISVTDAVAQLGERNVGALVVSNDGQTVNGIFSERDVVRALAREGPAALDLKVADLMTTTVTTCTGAETADEVMATMTEGRIRHVPVVEEGRLVGIVSIGDVVKSRMDDLEVQAEELQHYVTGTNY